MDVNLENDWKTKMGFPINYDSGQSTDDDFDTKDVVMRNPRSSSRFLLADGGDGAEADLLGTTPPRSRIRDKEKRKNFLESGANLQRLIRENKDVVDHATSPDISSVSERLRKRSSLKVIRSKERDFKLDMGQQNKADSLPSPNPAAVAPSVPTLLHSQVESCSRFMSLTSRPKCRELGPATETGIEQHSQQEWNEQLPANRVNFHKTFSMLINMGNIDKTCRRTISREEQVWQNELKDLIWLELQARVAGRSLAAQDAWLCAQRQQVPCVVKNISEYRFVNKNPCRRQAKRTGDVQSSREDLTDNEINDDDIDYGCLQLDCQTCADAVGRAMREVGALLDSFYNAVSLYPSSKAMTVDLPLVATNLFKNRLKALCLWFNTALNMRLKMLAVQRMLRSMRKSQRELRHRTSVDSDISRQSSSEPQKNCTVRFNVSNDPTPTGSNNSDSSYAKDDIKESPEEEIVGKEGKQKVGTETGATEKSEEDSARIEKSSERGLDDEVDSGVDMSRAAGQSTPEIVLDSRYSTVESSDAGYTSDASSAPYDAYDVGPLSELTQLVVLNKTKVSIYRKHHEEILKTQGVRRCMTFVNKMRKNILYKVFLTLEKPDMEQPRPEMEEVPAEVFHDAKEDEDKPDTDAESGCSELRRFGCWSEECMSMRLPSYRSHFLLLCSISMEAVHDYLSMRLEIKPEHPSCLTVKQLMHELRDGLDIATEMRADFVRNVQVALVGRSAGAAAADLLLLVKTFDNTVETMLELYLSYLTMMSVKEPLRRGLLQSEWAFVARLARRLRAAHRLAPVTFAKIACNQLDRLHTLFKDKFIKMVANEDQIETDRQAVYSLCRSAQYIFASEREHTLHAAQWARALAARLAKAPAPHYIAQRQEIFNSLMAIRDFIVKQVEYILEKSHPLAWEVSEPVVIRVRELLLQICKLGFELHRELYMFACAPLQPRTPGGRARPASLQPAPSAPRPAPPRPRPGTVLLHDTYNPLVGGVPAIHKELHRFANDPSLRRGSGGAASPPRPPRGKFLRLDSVLDDTETDAADNMHQFTDGRPQTSIELLLSGESPAEEQVELRSAASEPRASAEEKQWAFRVARAVIQFAKCWMQFVVERCDRGRGLRPRWASQGLEFLMLACDPCNTKHLTEEEFEELKQLMDGCISHVIGSRPAPDPCAASPRPRHRLHSPFSTSSSGKEVPTPPTPPIEPDPVMCFTGPESSGHSRRVLAAIQVVEAEREQLLRKSRRVGRVVTSTVSEYEPKLRQLSFKWQRGLKIGAGSFGKVYTVVNTESGQLVAMKELSVGADRRASQRAANELRVLEGVVHPHLVRYYGCELHREEMLIFMELCVEGSLEALVATSGGLGEDTVRRYTKQLLSAVAALHARSIAHRDIKSGNIFLTNEGHCLKLGDFGCAVKIRANTTAPNELQGFVGTQAYMAPEVFMKSSGHGRAADIWSVGCVVTEMASGKRPFSEYDSNYQIMFMVGMGSRPAIAASLSEEGRQFCALCLTHEPDLRPRADKLMMHTFLMVKADEDCKCETGFLITSNS